MKKIWHHLFHRSSSRVFLEWHVNHYRCSACKLPLMHRGKYIGVANPIDPIGM